MIANEEHDTDVLSREKNMTLVSRDKTRAADRATIPSRERIFFWSTRRDLCREVNKNRVERQALPELERDRHHSN